MEKKILWRDFASMYVIYDEENQKARDPLSSRVRGDVHELRKSQFKNYNLPNTRGAPYILTVIVKGPRPKTTTTA